MAIIKCKMCGGDLEITEGMSVAECEYCGSKQTIPTVDNEKKLTLFSRANRLRFACEFDKAAGVYEALVADFPEEAEAYWGLVLCKYGIEYVDDPATGKKIPTCHRSSFESVMDDSNFEQALENADSAARRVYREEAKHIEELRKGIIEVSGKEEPYDIFICYKETDETGSRTLDSVLAQDVYDALTNKGYRVFFSRITLEDKLGQEYEPYIFAALNSAKVMLAFGTDYEYFTAVWVRNEWSRFLQLMVQDKSKHLIPCYKGIDAYDMPREFAKLQAQDMGKVGAVQDLLRGIEKLMPQAGKTTGGSGTVSANAGALVKRGYIYLEDGEFQKAAEYFDRGLDENPEDSDAYLGKVMAARKARTQEALGAMPLELSQDKDFQRAVRYASPMQQKNLQSIQRRNAAAALVGLLYWYRQKNEACMTVLRNSVRHLTDAQNLPTESLLAGTANRDREDRIVREYLLEPYLDEGPIREALVFDFTYTSTVFSLQYWKGKALEAMARKQEKLAGKLYSWRDLKPVLEGSLAEIEASYDRAIAEAQTKDQEAVQKVMDRYELHLKELTQVKALRAQAEEARHADYTAARNLFDQKNFPQAKALFQRTALSGYLNSEMMLEECDRAAIRLKADAENTFQAIMAKRRAEMAEMGRLYAAMDEVRTKRQKLGFFQRKQGPLLDQQLLELRRQLSPKTYPWKNAAFQTIATYGNGVLCVRTDGTVAAAGSNDSGQNDVADWRDIVAVSSNGYHSVGVRSNGTVAAAGRQDAGQSDVSAWRDVAAVWTGYQKTAGLKSDGTMVYAGRDPSVYDMSGWRDIVDVAFGGTIIAGLRENGTVVAEGFIGYDVKHQIDAWRDIVAVSASSENIAGLKSDGTVVVATKDNCKFNQNSVSGWQNIVAIETCPDYIVGLRSDGTVVAAGSNQHRQCNVSGWKDIVAVSGSSENVVGLKSDGTVVATGWNREGECDVSELTEIISVKTDAFFTIGLRADGTAVATRYSKRYCDVSGWTGIRLPNL